MICLFTVNFVSFSIVSTLFRSFSSKFVLNGGITEEVIDLLLDFKAILQLTREGGGK